MKGPIVRSLRFLENLLQGFFFYYYFFFTLLKVDLLYPKVCRYPLLGTYEDLLVRG